MCFCAERVSSKGEFINAVDSDVSTAFDSDVTTALDSDVTTAVDSDLATAIVNLRRHNGCSE